MAELYSTQTTANTLASVAASGDVAWTDPGNAASSDDVYATAALNNQTTEILTALHWDFAIPDTSLVTGVKFYVEKKADYAGVTDLTVTLRLGGSANGANFAKATSWSLSDTVSVYEFMGALGLSYGDINDDTFGVGIAATAPATAEINIASIEGVGGAVTCTTSTDHNFADGASVVIAATTNFNGTYTITLVDPTSFTFAKAGDIAVEATGTAQQAKANLSIDNIFMTVFYNTPITPPTVVGPGPHRGHSR